MATSVWPPGTNITWGRTDQGVDGQAPTNTPALAVQSGTVQLAGPDPGGFGNSYVVLHTDQPINAGCGTFNAIYYGHLWPDASNGEHVAEGQQVAHAGQFGQGNASSEPGGFELGFWCSGPCANTGACATSFFKGLAPGSGPVPGSGGAPPASPQKALIPDFNEGPTAIPTPGVNAKLAVNDPISNLPIYEAQNVSPFTGGIFHYFGGSGIQPQQGVTGGNYGQLLHGSMKTAGTVGLDTPQFIVYFMWNPATIDFTYNFATNILPPQYQNPDVQKEINYLSNQTFEFTLLFDRIYEVGYFQENGQPPALNFNTPGWNNTPDADGPWTEGVNWDVRAVERLMGIYDQNSPDHPHLPTGYNISGGSMPLANSVDVAFGSTNAPVVRGFFNNVEVRYTRFSSDMVPTRCEIDITLIRVYLPETTKISAGGLNPYVATPTVY